MHKNTLFVAKNLIGKRKIQNSGLIKIIMGGRVQAGEGYLYIEINKI